MYSVLAIGVLYMVGMYYSTRAKKIKSTEEHTTYHEEGGVQARGDVPTVAISPAREMVGEDTGRPYATHPDDVLKVHKALQKGGAGCRGSCTRSPSDAEVPRCRSLTQRVQRSGREGQRDVQVPRIG